MSDLVHKDLSYKIVGIAFEIYNTLGSDLKEKVYGNAFEELLKREKIAFKRELYYPLTINGKVIGQNYFDFIVNEEVIVELKVGSKKYKEVCNQTFEYLRSSGLKLGIVMRFTKDGVKIKRIPNLY